MSLREDRGLQAVPRRVRLLDRVVEARRARERHDGAEHLLALHLVVAAGFGDHRRPDEPVAGRLAAGQHLALRLARSTRGCGRARRSLITGPTSVASSAGSPTLSASTFGTNSATNASHASVEHEDPLHRDAALAGERERVRGELRRRCRPARRRRRSRVSRCRARASRASRCARSAMPQPTSPEPVNVISFTRSSSTSTSPICRRRARDDVEPARRAGRPPPRARRGRAPRAASPTRA